MLADMGKPSDLDRKGWLFEPKLDGTRAICYKNHSLRFINRRGNEITSRYPEFAFSEDIMADTCVLDGEVLVYDDKGNPSFRLLQRREHVTPERYASRSTLYPATYVVFDILELNGKDLTGLPLEERKGHLDRVVREGAHLQKTVYTTEGRKLWELVRKARVEGVMAKRLGSVYEPGHRSSSWLKIKALKTVDCVIAGYTHEKREISALVLGLYDDRGRLVYIGRVGTGFTEDFLHDLRLLLDTMRQEGPSVVEPPERDVAWVRPELVCEVEFLEVTAHGHLRAPSFKRLRDDKGPEECRIEDLGPHGPPDS